MVQSVYESFPFVILIVVLMAISPSVSPRIRGTVDASYLCRDGGGAVNRQGSSADQLTNFVN